MTVIEPCTFARQLGMVGDFIRWIGNIAGFLLAECHISLNYPCRTSHSSPRTASNLGGRPTLARQQELRISSQSGTRIATGAGKPLFNPSLTTTIPSTTSFLSPKNPNHKHRCDFKHQATRSSPSQPSKQPPYPRRHHVGPGARACSRQLQEEVD